MKFKLVIYFAIAVVIIACNSAANSLATGNSSKDSFQIKVTSYTFEGEGNNRKLIFEIDKKDNFSLSEGTEFDFISEIGSYTLKFNKELTTDIVDRRKFECTPVSDINEIYNTLSLTNYVVNKGGKIVKNENKHAGKKVLFTSKLNGEKWEASSTYKGFLYYAKGIKQMDASGNPYLMLAFVCTNSPDNRQLTISAKNFKGETGIVKNMEVLFSGSKTGENKKSELQGCQDNPAYPEQKTNFAVNITKWEISGDKIICSGKISGKLKGILGASDVEFSDGIFENIEIEMFNSAY